MKVILSIVGVLGSLGAIALMPDEYVAGLKSLAFWETPSAAATQTSSSSYRLAEVERGRVVEAIAATGTITPVALVLVSTQVSGQIQNIHADFNTEVRRGDPIASFDPASFQNALDQAEAELGMAQASHLRAKIALREAEADQSRKRSLFSSGAGSAIERARAETARDLADASVQDAAASVEKWRAAVNQARTNLDRTVIRSPVDGTVINRNVEVGQVIAASLSTPTLFTIAQDLREMQVNAAVPESDIGRVKVGQAIEFTVDTYTDRVFRGQVTQIRQQPQTNQNVVTYTAVASAPNPDRLLLPGMTATAKLIVREQSDALSVPLAALRFRLPGEARSNVSRVLVERNGNVSAVPVKVGISDGKMAAVEADGLQPSDQVIVGLPVATKKSAAESRGMIGGF